MTVKLNLSNELTVSAIENLSLDSDLEGDLSENKWLLNLCNVNYVHTDALLYLITLIAHRAEQGKITTVKLPLSQKPFSFMVRWRFPEVFEAVTNTDFSENCERKSDLDVINDENATLPYSRNIVDLGPSKASLRSQAFIDTLVYNIHENGQGSIVRDQHELYDDPYIKSVLETKFIGSYRSAIINTLSELISNAFEHPDATKLIIMSHCPTKSKPDEEIAFKTNPDEEIELCVFDDGESIPSTLRKAQSEGLNIFKSVEKKSVSVSVVIDATKSEDIHLSKVMSSETLLNPEEAPKSIEELLIAAIFPGVSSRKSANKRSAEDDFPEFRGKLDGDGNGLFISAYVACHLGSGSLEIRTGLFVLTILSDNSQTDIPQGRFGFSVNLRKLNNPDICLHGNMITVRMFPKVRNGDGDVIN